MLRELVRVSVEQLGQDVAIVEEHAPNPREVVEPDLIDDDALRLDAEQVREVALEADRDVAEADRAMTGVEQRRA